MQIGNSVYTANMLRTLLFLPTIAIAVIVSALVSTGQRNARIKHLIHSSSITDQISGISLLTSHSYDVCLDHVSPLLKDETLSSKKAQGLLVAKAFQENRVADLVDTGIDHALLQSALWWDAPKNPQQEFSFPISIQNSSPWVPLLSAFYDTKFGQNNYMKLVELSMRDRDGSVLLFVLVMNKLAPENIEPLIRTWETSFDIEKQKTALLLRALRGLPINEIHSSDSSLQTIHSILKEKNTMLAWRSMHREDGTIIPDIALAGMIVDKTKYTPSLIESAQQNLWVHPEHPILLASTFSKEIALQIPTELLVNYESRQKWWALFACGLLQEGR